MNGSKYGNERRGMIRHYTCSDTMELLKKYRHRTNLTACAIELKKMVGAD